MYRYGGGNKYGAIRTYSELCGRTFDSKSEARRGEQLFLANKAGAITDLEYQVTYSLCNEPKKNCKIKIDFRYKENGNLYHEDVKGMGETRDFRTKRIFFYVLYGYEIFITS